MLARGVLRRRHPDGLMYVLVWNGGIIEATLYDCDEKIIGTWRAANEP